MQSLEPAESFVPALLRANWMLLGHAAALVVALSITQLAPWTLGWRDAIYWTFVASLVGSRWIDATRYGGTTAQGDTPTHAMLVRWTLGVLAAFTLLWLGVQSIAL